jgi:hypothetical protein
LDLKPIAARQQAAEELDARLSGKWSKSAGARKSHKLQFFPIRC